MSAVDLVLVAGLVTATYCIFQGAFYSKIIHGYKGGLTDKLAAATASGTNVFYLKRYGDQKFTLALVKPILLNCELLSS